MGIADLVVRIVLVSEVEHDGSTLKDTKISILQGGNTSVRVDLEVPWLLLHVLRNVNLVDVVLETQLFQSDGGLETIRRPEAVKVEVVVWRRHLCAGNAGD